MKGGVRPPASAVSSICLSSEGSRRISRTCWRNLRCFQMRWARKPRTISGKDEDGEVAEPGEEGSTLLGEVAEEAAGEDEGLAPDE